MSATNALDLLGATLVLLGAFLCFAAAVGLVRFPDVLARMHAATKPQTLGLILVAVGVEVSLRTWAVFGTILLVVVLQLATAPMAAHLVGRTVYRSNQVRRDLLVRDDLAEDLARAGFTLAPAEDRRSEDERAEDERAEHESAGDERAGDERAGDERAGDERAGDERTGEEPA